MAWFTLILAGLFECFWATMLKLSQGFSVLRFSVLTVVGMIASFLLLAHATRALPLSLAYPIWTGIGAVGAVLIGVVWFGDRLTPATWFFVALLLIGIVGLKLTSHA
ncbi:DMT family transporter [Lacticaseibacillus mingshuiensis]|uniref:DMT family transporter n=1 Tax=Lacticaseibacillus mingshuiensis TaxID=2799574 RepID=A0ABW4CG08_9LACO|nr:multidrug efflux SMR transporter [Lacticaseibacillus mingshuiensis]